MLVLGESKTLSIPLYVIEVHPFSGDFDYLSIGRLSHNKLTTPLGKELRILSLVFLGDFFLLFILGSFC
jgi:hypothetical protein